MKTKENTIICFKAQITGKMDIRVSLCAGRHKMYLYTVKYSNFTRSALYIYINLRGTRYVTAGL
jgi:hypothetical protein